MTDYESVARQRLYLVHDSDRLERRFPERNRNVEAILFGFGLVMAVVIAPWLIALVFFSLVLP